eukprot:scaffold213170_cov24-Tisochrysis_lutea.AAC.1
MLVATTWDKSRTNCIFCRSYRAFYILNWIYRYFTEPVKIQVLGELYSPSHECACLLNGACRDSNSREPLISNPKVSLPPSWSRPEVKSKASLPQLPAACPAQHMIPSTGLSADLHPHCVLTL